MRMLRGNLIVPMCLHMPTLILPPKWFRELYFNPECQGQYTSRFPSGGYGFLQSQDNIQESIIPRNFRVLPADIQEAIDLYFHQEDLEAHALAGYATGEDQDRDHEMSTDIEALQNVSQLHLNDQGASESLWEAVHDTLVQATVP